MKTTTSSPLRALILDMDGVLWKNYQPIGDLPAIFARIRALGLNFIMATNNATRTPAWYLDRMAQFGVHLEPWQVINSAEATAEYLRQRFPQGGPVYAIGEEGLLNALRRRGFTLDGEEALAVVAGLDKHLTYEKIKRANALIRRGAPFVGTNPDRTFPTPQGQVPGAGTILAAIEAASGVPPIVIGKPGAAMYRLALARLGARPEETLVVGDRLETDIAGAQNAGCRAALVLSGVTSPAEAAQWQPAPDWIAKDLTTLLELLSAERRQTADS